MTDFALNDLAFQNGDLLDAIAVGPPEGDRWKVMDLAQSIGRDDSNVHKTMKKLTAAGFLRDPALDGLTPEGEAQLAAWRRAMGGDAPKAERWPIDRIRPNPDNRRIDPAGIPDLADSIIGAGDVLQPVLLTPPDAHGVRMLLAGERRWRAATALAGEGRMPPALAAGLPFFEREADEGDALLITVIENSQRDDLSPWDDAKLLYRLMEKKGWNATQLARNVGRAGEVEGQKRPGVRDVQWKVKVAKEASPEAIAAYEADPDRPGAWEALRDSVRKSGGPQNVHLALFLVEAALASDEEAGAWDVALDLKPGLEWPVGWEKWFTYDRDNGSLILTKAATDWLAEEGLGEDLTDTVLTRWRAKVGMPHRHERKPWVSEVLNPSAESVADAEDDPLVVNGVRFPNASRAADARRAAGLEPSYANYGSGPRPSAPPGPVRTPEDGRVVETPEAPGLPLHRDAEPGGDAEPQSAPLNAVQMCALIELAHKIQERGHDGPTGRMATVGAFWLGPAANDLVHHRLARFVQSPGGKPPMGALTEQGQGRLIAEGLARDGAVHIRDADVKAAQAAVGKVVWPDGYVTAWLAKEVAPPADLPVADPVGEQVDLEAEAASAVLDSVRGLIESAALGQAVALERVSELFTSVHGFGPLCPTEDGAVLNNKGEVVLTFDPHGDLPEDLAHAGALLTAFVLNTGMGFAPAAKAAAEAA